MLDQGCGRDASPNWVGRQFLADIMDDNKRCIFVDEIQAVPDTNILTVNI